jgi:hypothetical protein
VKCCLKTLDCEINIEFCCFYVTVKDVTAGALTFQYREQRLAAVFVGSCCQHCGVFLVNFAGLPCH